MIWTSKLRDIAEIPFDGAFGVSTLEDVDRNQVSDGVIVGSRLSSSSWKDDSVADFIEEAAAYKNKNHSTKQRRGTNASLSFFKAEAGEMTSDLDENENFRQTENSWAGRQKWKSPAPIRRL